METYHFSLINDFKKYCRIMPNRKVLVVGCNQGVECELFRKEGATDITGIDIISDVGSGYPHDSINYVCDNAHNMPFEDESFNISTSFATLEHIPDPLKAVEEMVRVTASRGVIYIQAAPLWCEPYGHHKKNLFPKDPWIHLRYPKQELMKEYYGELCHDNFDGKPISNHIDYIFSDAFNRYNVDSYKKILCSIMDQVTPIAVRFITNFEYLSLMTPEIRKELSEYSEENLFTSSLTWVLRKK